VPGCPTDACASGRIMPVEMKHAPASRKFDRGVLGCVGQTIVAVPNDSALSCAGVDDDEGRLSGCSRNHLSEVDIDAVCFQRLKPKLSSSVRPKAAGIGSFQTKSL